MSAVDTFTMTAPQRAAPPDRTRLAFFNWASTAAYTGITVLVAIVATPLLLKYLGAERLGANRAASEWFGYLVMAEIGLGPALNVIFLRVHAANDPVQLASTMRFVLRAYARLTVVLLPLGLLLAWTLPYLIPVQPAMVRELRWAAIIAQAAFLLYPLSTFRSLLETQQHGYVVVSALIVQSLTVTTLALVLAYCGWGLVGQSIALVAGTIIFYLIIAKAGFGRLMPLSQVPTAKMGIAPLWRLAWPFAITGLAGRLNLMTDNIVVGFVLGPTSVAAFYLTQRLVSLVGGQVNALVGASWAGLADLKNSGDHEAFEARVVELARLAIGLGLTLTGAVTAYNGAFVRLWVGESQYGGDLLTVITAANLVVFGFLLLFTWILDFQGDAKLRLKVCLSGAILNLVLSLWLAHTRLGMAGVALGTLIAYCLTEAWYSPYLVCAHYGVRARKLVAGCVHGAALGLPWGVGMWYLAHSHPLLWAGSGVKVMQWLGLTLECGGAGVLSLLYCWTFILSAAERAQWLSRFSRAAKPRRGAAVKASPA